jgi:hypothetical protein
LTIAHFLLHFATKTKTNNAEGNVFDFIAYLFYTDQTAVIFLNRWFDVSQWYIIYPLASLHTCAWVLFKVGLFRGPAALVQYIVARRKASATFHIQSSAWYRRLFRGLWHAIVYLSHKAYAGAKRLAHGKVVMVSSLFWLSLIPQLRQLGEAIVGIRWQQFGWRGVTALCLGGSLQTSCYCLLYSFYGEARKAEAQQIMYWIMVPLGVIMLLGWVLKNGRKQLE